MAYVHCDKCHTGYATTMRKPGRRCGDCSLDPGLLPCKGIVRKAHNHTERNCPTLGCWSYGNARERTS